jgi:hypothetical protein
VQATGIACADGDRAFDPDDTTPTISDAGIAAD